jgi:ketosteroid isomerase-like protein
VSIEQNEALVTSTWQKLLGGDVDAAVANLSDDVTWWLTLPC